MLHCVITCLLWNFEFGGTLYFYIMLIPCSAPKMLSHDHSFAAVYRLITGRYGKLIQNLVSIGSTKGYS
uniref:Uncharacterized protein n=1 Tax=Aegilops tauschii subsp. strangulata TaxID=200361 RepID=A0A453SAQ5_AEGTS